MFIVRVKYNKLPICTNTYSYDGLRLYLQYSCSDAIMIAFKKDFRCHMFNKEMYSLGSKRSVIRELFEYGKQRAAQYGADSVFDFSLGNPSVAAPDCVNSAIKELVETLDSAALHGYTSAQGDFGVRRTVAEFLNEKYSARYSADNIYMTCGAAAGLAIAIRALCEKGDEFILIAPHFPEYNVFVKAAGGTPITVPFSDDFQIDIESLKNALTPRTKAVIVNSPNNPCGVIYTQKTLAALAEVLSEFEKKFFKPIYIIADEPYRELAYGDADVPFIPSIYADTVLCYSFSKSLSLAGERIGYLAVNPDSQNARDLYLAIMGAGRAMGYVCAPVLFQRVAAKCIAARPKIEEYKVNRDFLYGALSEIGYECVYPDGAFYLFVKAIGSSAEFSEKAKKYGLLIVPADDFAAPGWIRIAYCVDADMIRRSVPLFAQLYNECTQDK